MGLAAAFQSAAQAAVTALGDLSSTITVTQKGSATYNVSTGALTETSASESVSGVVMDYDERALTNQAIALNDRKVLIPGKQFSSITPEQGDELTISGETYIVIRASVDAAQALWTLQARRQT